MNILVNGPSPSRGENSWPYVLQEFYNANLVNLSQAGAGNYYISDSTITELAQRKYDLVIIMWADLRRFDVKVKDIDKFSDTIYTSKHQKTMNDWQSKKIWPVNDQDYVDDNWVFGCGYINTQDTSVVDLFDTYYKHTDLTEQYYMSYMKIIALQSFLKSINQPYLFCGVRRLAKLDRVEHLYNLIDFDNYFNDVTIHELAEQYNSWADPTHPGEQAHREFADRLIKLIDNKKIL